MAQAERSGLKGTRPPSAPAGFRHAFLRECLRCGALEAPPGDAKGWSRLRRLERLCGALDVEPVVAALILELLERIDALETELRRR